ncbi:hypothetical protein [Streptomyces sp. NPDC058613]|uniref:hypothetical protein n=1 Tax=unclassified Streptomyces TaxID=2593676 RepID=UPI003651954C
MLDISVDRCASLHCRAHGERGDVQLVFQFKPGPTGASGMVMVRIDVPAPYVASAVRFLVEVRARHGIVALEEGGSEEQTLSRIPADDSRWIAAPTNADSEGLYKEIFDRIAAEPAS